MGLLERLVVLLGEFWQAELVVLRVAEVFFREDLTVILHTLRLVYHLLRNVSCLHLISLVLLLYDILLNAFIYESVLLTIVRSI